MKTKNFMRVLTLVLALAMMLSLSMMSFATDTVNLYVNGVSQGTCNINYTSGGILVNTVYDILSIKYGTAAVWSDEYDAVEAYSPLCKSGDPLNGKYDEMVVYLTSLNGTGSAPHIPVAGSVNSDGTYIPTQTVDTVLMDADAQLRQAGYQGLASFSSNGYGYSVDGTHGIYIGWDWTFTVDGVEPGCDINPPSPIYGDRFAYTMRESILSSGNRVDLDYGYSIFIFSLS